MNFDDIANLFLNGVVLNVKSEQFRICEVEIYYCGNDHYDHYSHNADEQLEFLKIYFHKYNNGTFKSGTWKCMDFCLGNRENNIYFGVLIRSILNLKDNTFIEGPCNCVNTILKILGYDDIESYMKSRNYKLVDLRNDDIYLTKGGLNKESIYVGTRIGLNKDKYPEYIDKLYRYIVFKDRIKKEKSKLILL